MKQKTQITFEQEETVVLRKSANHVLEFCLKCDGEVVFVAPEVLASMTDSSDREVFRLIESGAISFVEKQRTYACLLCYLNAIGQRPSASEIAAIKKLGE